MIANYHTHTWRCNHADGFEREYVEKAIESGLKILGFSDHTPYLYPDGYVSRSKMLPSQLEDYVNVVLRLRDEYKDDIEIHLGLEAEYYPALWDELLRFLEPYPLEYMILGQHFIGNEIDDQDYCAMPTSDPGRLHKYCAQCMEALETGKFAYFAHPDILNFTGEDDIYEAEITQLCCFCRENNIPLEINLLGLREDRNYPRRLFWEIAAREGNTVIYGSDAHHVEHVYVPTVIRKADRLLEQCGIPEHRLLKTLPPECLQ